MQRILSALLLALLLVSSLQDRAWAASTPPEKTASGSPGENPNKHATFNPVLTIQLQRDAAMWGEGTVLDVDVGPNLYAYVKQNPWSAFDPDGLQEKKPNKEDILKKIDRLDKKAQKQYRHWMALQDHISSMKRDSSDPNQIDELYQNDLNTAKGEWYKTRVMVGQEIMRLMEHYGGEKTENAGPNGRPNLINLNPNRLTHNGQPTMPLMTQYPMWENVIYLAAHGNQNYLVNQVGEKPFLISGNEIGKRIATLRQTKFKDAVAIFCLGCEGGAFEYGVAGNSARKSGLPVIGASEKTWFYEKGGVKVFRASKGGRVTVNRNSRGQVTNVQWGPVERDRNGHKILFPNPLQPGHWLGYGGNDYLNK